jgi:hypothetical protein
MMFSSAALAVSGPVFFSGFAAGISDGADFGNNGGELGQTGDVMCCLTVQ